ncbi:hypothetical protein CLOM_g8791 [Closterium sp. NIES-68]|nr:hypothetical protein CLOM_g8791 [Closterium sp. NIES-68]GJP63882.1 hypothetical protein CLOP_g20914 [Closterium sp. NIES-67]
MSEVFGEYERRYCEISGNAKRQAAAIPSLAADAREQRAKDVNASLEEADSLIRRMDLEARSLPAAQKAALLVKLREYKADLQTLRRDLQRALQDAAATANEAARDQLLGNAGGAGGQGGEGMSQEELAATGAQRMRLLGATEQLGESSQRLEASKRALLETEELGVSILEDLHNQRQTLLSARDNLYGVDASIDRGRQILNSMARRMNRNKWISIFILIVLILAIIIVIFVKMHRH